MRLSLQPRPARLRAGLWPIAQSAVAAGVAWWVAGELLSVSRPLFAPIAALISLGHTTGRRGRKAVQVVLGVAFGVAVADLIGAALGSSAYEIGLVVVLAMAATLLVSDSSGAVVQAGVTGLIVAAAPRPASGVSADRLLEALIGGGVALVFSQLLFPVDPLRRARDAVGNVVDGIAAALDETATSLTEPDGDSRDLESKALELDERRARLDEALALAGEAVRLTRGRRGRRGEVRRYGEAHRWLHLAAHDVAAVARGAARLERAGERERAAASASELAAAARAVGGDVRAAHRDEVNRHLVAATSSLPPEEELSLSGAFVAGALLDLARDLGEAAGAPLDEARGRQAASAG
ncbi:MAG TPA: FUSC family protein [Gaiellaceae bacterium]